MNTALIRQSFHIEKILRNEPLHCEVLLKCEKGSGLATVYRLPGDTLVAFFDFSAQAYLIGASRREQVLEINYCTDGRSEHVLSDGSVQFIGPGDCSVTLESQHTGRAAFPQGRYRGVGIVIDLVKQEARKQESYGVALGGDLDLIVEKCRRFGSDIAVPLPASIAGFTPPEEGFSEELMVSYLQLHLNELLLYLQTYPMEKLKESAPKTHSRREAEAIKAVRRQMAEDLSKRPSLRELARAHYMSETKLKRLFKEVYGKPPGRYMADLRMDRAKALLDETELPVSEIAGMLGFSGSGNFSVAFKAAHGMSPREYRNRDRR